MLILEADLFLVDPTPPRGKLKSIKWAEFEAEEKVWVVQYELNYILSTNSSHHW